MELYSLPHIEFGPKVYFANELEDVLDWGLQAHGVNEAWRTKGDGITIGIADTGLPDHADLDGAILEAKNFSTAREVLDRRGHGTHVAGIIAARENGLGTVGVAPLSKLVVAKVLDNDGVSGLEPLLKGIAYLIEKKCDIISLSFTGPHHPELERLVNYAVDSGIFVFCAAGNTGKLKGMQRQLGCPAHLASTIAVGSYNRKGAISEFSSVGPEIDIACPGENILSTWLENTYRRMSGTSMAAPFAAGLFAERLAQQRKALAEGKIVDNLIANNADLIAWLKSIAIDMGPKGFDISWGWGVIDTRKLLVGDSSKE